MTAIHAIRMDDEIIMLTDGACYDNGGILREIRTKVVAHATLPIAVTVTGDVEILRQLGPVMRTPEVHSFDELLQAARWTLAVMQEMERIGMVVPVSDIIIAGFDESGEARLAVAHAGTHELAIDPDRRPYTLREVERDELGIGQYCRGPMMRPADIATFAELQQKNAHLGAVEFFRTYGADYFELYRRSKSRDLQWSLERYMVGGKVDFTEISREGVTTTTLRTWPDKIGESIGQAVYGS